jgi:hypothetical protein
MHLRITQDHGRKPASTLAQEELLPAPGDSTDTVTSRLRITSFLAPCPVLFHVLGGVPFGTSEAE